MRSLVTMRAKEGETKKEIGFSNFSSRNTFQNNKHHNNKHRYNDKNKMFFDKNNKHNNIKFFNNNHTNKKLKNEELNKKPNGSLRLTINVGLKTKKYVYNGQLKKQKITCLIGPQGSFRGPIVVVG